MISTIGITACASYLASTAAIFHSQRANKHKPYLPAITLCAIGLLCHGWSTYPLVVTSSGVNLSFFIAASLIFLFVAGLGFISLLRKQDVDNLLLLLLPIAALTVACSFLLGATYTPRSDISLGIAAHILLSILASGMLTLAALQAVLLDLLMRQLKHRQTHGLIDRLPPLQTMETLLFRMLWAGFILLSMALVLGALFIEDLFAQHLAHKTSLSIAAWLIFAVLLWGIHQRGWRGKKAVRGTFIGLLVLMVGFFGSKLVLEILLSGT